MDAYRLDSALEAEQLDLDIMLADGALLIEESGGARNHYIGRPEDLRTEVRQIVSGERVFAHFCTFTVTVT